ncbi:MAG: YCF48-related protein [Ignavibacteria bacterium]
MHLTGIHSSVSNHSLDLRKIFLQTILLISLVTYSVYSQGSWIPYKTPTNKNLKSIFFIDSLKGWIAGDSGLIMFTSNGGQNWQLQQTNVNTSIHDIYFLDSLYGWGLTWHQNIYGPLGTTFLKTTNGGLYWIAEQYPKDFTFFYSIIFNDTLNGWVCGYPGSILRTNNGGSEWREVKFTNVQFSQFPIFKIRFFNQNIGIGCGGVIDIFGVIWRTTDGGEFWDSFPVGPEPINDFQIISEDFVFAVGGDYEYGTAVSHSTDMGLNWNYRTLDIFGIANSVAFRNPKEGWLNLKDEKKFLVTIDSGKTWVEYFFPVSLKPNKIIFTDSLHGYAVCDSGYILKYKPDFKTSIKDNNTIGGSSKKTLELKIFPNPVNLSSNIHFELNSPGYLKVEIYTILGEKLKTLVDNFFEAGTYNLTLNASDIQSGVYFIKLSQEKNFIVRKLVILK